MGKKILILAFIIIICSCSCDIGHRGHYDVIDSPSTSSWIVRTDSGREVNVFPYGGYVYEYSSKGEHIFTRTRWPGKGKTTTFPDWGL